jgi:cold shock CspA family protein
MKEFNVFVVFDLEAEDAGDAVEKLGAALRTQPFPCELHDVLEMDDEPLDVWHEDQTAHEEGAVHVNDYLRRRISGEKQLVGGERVEFELAKDPDGRPRAVEVHVLV